MLIFKDGNLEVESSDRVVTGEEADAIAQAQELLARAHAEAERILKEVEAFREQSRKEASEAFEKARADGFQQGLDEGQASIIEQKIKMVEKSAGYLEELEGRVVDVVEAVLEKCAGVLDCHAVVVGLANETMAAVVRTQRQMTIRVRAENLAVVKEHVEEWCAKYPSINMLNVVEDSTLPPTGCVLETDAGIVDASLNVQLDAITRAFRKCFAKKE